MSSDATALKPAPSPLLAPVPLAVTPCVRVVPPCCRYANMEGMDVK